MVYTVGACACCYSNTNFVVVAMVVSHGVTEVSCYSVTWSFLTCRCLQRAHRSWYGTFTWTIWVCVCLCMQSVLWQNGWLDPDAVWGGEWGRAWYECIRFW